MIEAKGRTSRTLNRVMLIALALAAAGVVYRVHDRITRAAERGEAIERAKKGSPSESLEALAALEPFLASDPDDPELLEAACIASMRAGKPDDVVEPLLKRWFDRDPHRLAPVEARLRSLRAWNRPAAEQIPVLERWIQLDPDSTGRRLELASLYQIVGRFDDALREARHALPMPNANRTEARTAIARAKFARGEYSAAAAELDALLQSEPNRTSALLLRAQVHQKLGDDRSAAAILQKLQPKELSERVAVLNHLGQSLARLERPDEAKATFDRLSLLQEAMHHAGDARQLPRDRAYQKRAAKSLLKADLPQEAVELLQDAIQRLGPDRDTLRLLADCHERLGNSARAREVRAEADRLR